MAALFPRSANRVARRVLLAVVAVVIGLPLALMAWVRTPPVTGQHRAPEQPIPFSHPIHVTGLRIDCRYCHYTVERAATAGMPSTETCVPCHSTAWREGPLFRPVRQSLATGRPLQWRRVNSLPDYVYFNHAIHLRGGVACASCHGQVERMQRVQQATPLTMGWCLDCHRQSDPAVRARITDCTACHR